MILQCALALLSCLPALPQEPDTSRLATADEDLADITRVFEEAVSREGNSAPEWHRRT